MDKCHNSDDTAGYDVSHSQPVAMAQTPHQRSILSLTCDEARAFFLKQESYCSIDLPPYFHFNDLLDGVSKQLSINPLASLQSEKPRSYEDVNHRILNNKDGKHAWRPFEIIHPALYVSLIRSLTEQTNWNTICSRFSEFGAIDRIRCLSIPVQSLTEEKDKAEQVSRWWHEIEQNSIELALDYECTVHADITDCYGAIYTHSIAWAIHGKSEAKRNRRDFALIGNIIDNSIQDMRHGQTNGIPQGTVLMDFIAETLLGFADMELAKRIEDAGVNDYLILRYRDDYRIFVNSLQDGDRILKCLTEVMIGLGLKLNTAKTKTSSLVITESLKPDKLAWMNTKQNERNLQKRLLTIFSHSMTFPNSGSVVSALADYFKLLSRRKKYDNPLPLISIAVDIAYRNPRTYPICSAILSKLLSFFDSNETKKRIFKKIVRRFKQIPNTGHMELWLQRISLPFAPDMEFDEPLCQLARGMDVSIWNSEWVSSRELKTALDARSIFDDSIVKELAPIISTKEVELFLSKSDPSL